MTSEQRCPSWGFLASLGMTGTPRRLERSVSVRYPYVTVAGLLIKDFPKELHRKLSVRATANRRTLSGEAITILETVLNDRSGPLTLDEIDRLRAHGAR